MSVGKSFRLKRIFPKEDNKVVIVPIDHGVTIGPIEGIVDVKKCMKSIVDGGGNGVIVHKGLAKHSVSTIKANNSLIIHISASTNIGNNIMNKVSVCSVEEAISLGADAVSMHINFGCANEPEQIKEVARISKDCYKYGIPLLVMAYVRGEGKELNNAFNICHAARIAIELGADIVKCNYTGDIDSFFKVVESCPAPILIAGGEKVDKIEDLFEIVCDSMLAGAAGISIGRNVFESKYPVFVTKVLSKIVHENLSKEKAIEYYNSLINSPHVIISEKIKRYS